MEDSAVVFVGIAPHPPIMVPEVGGEMSATVSSSIDAMHVMADRVRATRAETLIIISPHAPLEASSFVAYGDLRLRGDFANFRAPEATVDAQLDVDLLESIRDGAASAGLGVTQCKQCELDHGTAVPLYFLQRNGWQGRVVALGYSFLPNNEHTRFGSAIRRAVDSFGRPTAFIASGDLSHRLKPGAPAGFSRDAHLFDEEVVEAIRTSDPGRIVNIDQRLRETAGECGYRSMLVALGLATGLSQNYEVLSYEAPFGVGYLVAQISNRGH